MNSISICLLCNKKLKSGFRKDVKIRHLVKACSKFVKNVSPFADLLETAKIYADDFFDVTSA